MSADLATLELASRWGLPDLLPRLQALEPGLELEAVAATASTNTALLERAAAWRSRGAQRHQEPLQACLLVAEEQTQGRGRQGRAWQARRGASLTFSLALMLAPRDWSGLSLAVGVALAEALDPPCRAGRGAAHRIGLKWPNDLWLLDAAAPGGGRKLGGVLIETAGGGMSPERTCVIGVGLNVQPQAVEGASSGVAWLQEMQPQATAPAVLAQVAPALLAGVRRFEREGFASVEPAFAQRDLLRGQGVSTTLRDLPDGIAEGVDASGALRLRTPHGALHSVVGGEVSVRLLSGSPS